MEYHENTKLQLAYDFVQYTNRNVFLTGKAGTGKTTFLTRLREITPKRLIVLAPTGVAAINAGGSTIHSFFQIPFGPYVQGYDFVNGGQNKFKFSKVKIDIIRTLDLLIIDEISMVRADLLDAIDFVLRHYRGCQLPFGGVQLLMIGDLNQLAPVVKNDEWDVLRNFYSSMYFFGSNALQQTNYVTIELDKIYRQNSQDFIDILNKVRDNKADRQTFEALNQRYIPNFQPKDKDGYITLTTHNYQANDINQSQLKKLKAKLKKYDAIIEGNFSESMYPADFTLELKEGAQVMFIKNDTSIDKLYYNGKIGRIINIEDDIIYVQCKDDNEVIATQPVKWENIVYRINETTKQIEEKVDGTFSQYPLKLAWAITIHKSQGLTFDKVVIDAAQAFSPGQVYVALSRCRTLEGVVLMSQIGDGCIFADQQVNRFNQQQSQVVLNDAVLNESKLHYEYDLITNLFDFKEIAQLLDRCYNHLSRHSKILLGNPAEKVATLQENFALAIEKVSEKFAVQIKQLLAESNVEQNKLLQERISKGCVYFIGKIEELIVAPFDSLSISTDNAEVQANAEKLIDEILKLVDKKLYCLDAVKSRFSVDEYLHIRAMSHFKAKRRKTVSKDGAKTVEEVANKALFIQIIQWRAAEAKERNVPPYFVLPQKALLQIVEKLPDSATALAKIKGIGKEKMNRYGSKLVEMVRNYKMQNNIPLVDTSMSLFDNTAKTLSKSKSRSEKKKAAVKEPTQKLTFDLYIEGLSVEQIARKRNLTTGTIVNHLAHYVANGKLDPTDIIDPQKVEIVAEYCEKTKTKSRKQIKETFGESISYDEINIILNWLEYQANN